MFVECVWLCVLFGRGSEPSCRAYVTSFVYFDYNSSSAPNTVVHNMFGYIRHVRFPCDIYFIRHLDKKRTTYIFRTHTGLTNTKLVLGVCDCVYVYFVTQPNGISITNCWHSFSLSGPNSVTENRYRSKKATAAFRASFSQHESIEPMTTV